jgi:membrane protease YdiL (CAAX protease family)
MRNDRNLVQRHPVVTFLLITFAWTWLFWLAAIPFREQSLLLTAFVMIGGFGPAVGGIVTLSLQSGSKPGLSAKRALVWAAATASIFGLFALRYLVGNIPNYETLAADLTLTAPVVLASLAASVVGGWVVSSVVSSSSAVRSRMVSMLPLRLPAGWTLLGLLFYPALILVAWGLSVLVGAGVEYPGLWGRPALEVLPYYALTFVVVAVAQGGNEEPGWRGFLQPELQKRFSPLVAALLVSLAWSLWHLPLYLNGFYGEPLVGGMIGGGIFRVLLAIFLAWFYNRSGGNLFLMIFLHTSFNLMVNFLPTSDLGLLVLWLVVVVGLVLKEKLYRRPAQAVRPERAAVAHQPLLP